MWTSCTPNVAAQSGLMQDCRAISVEIAVEMGILPECELKSEKRIVAETTSTSKLISSSVCSQVNP